jgi:hypothetical protein
MSNLSDKTTIYLNPMVKKFISHKAIEDGSSVSAVINEHFADLLEDLSDVVEIEKRRGEATVSFDEVLKGLKLTYNDLQG